MSETEKPATQTVAASGLDAHGAMGGEPLGLNLELLAKYPPFQMYIESIEPNEQGIDGVKYAMERARAAHNLAGEAFIEGYLVWWTSKGYWRGEDPMGGRAS
ncbi:hypothetical protein [Dyella japonica]|uniref:Uncharacterized protein n=1 Tax=Dyella japonica DSM 16301 TaxID=1440762 RepID=A0A0G9H6G0_9GAMM|nr:hypothetical protein [Dyella japonica]KLD65425.1 hypothetical protein Y882_02570 [Dyella japonica DSM 16301]